MKGIVVEGIAASRRGTDEEVFNKNWCCAAINRVQTRSAMLESIDHVNIVVKDLDLMADFYSRVMGMKITKRVAISGPWIDQTVGLTSVHADVIYLDLPEGARLELI